MRKRETAVIPTDANVRMPARWRTPTAIALAVMVGVPAGLFLKASAVPFGPILVGWFVAFVGAVVASVSLCVLATRRYILVGLGYAAGVAATVVVATIATSGIQDKWWIPPAQFAAIFTIVGCASLLGSGLCAILKWEDKKARSVVASNAEQSADAIRRI